MNNDNFPLKLLKAGFRPHLGKTKQFCSVHPRA